MKNLKIATKLFVAFGTVIAFLLATAILSTIGISILSDNFVDFYNGPHQNSVDAMDMRRGMNAAERALVMSFVYDDNSLTLASVDECKRAIKEFEEKFADFTERYTGDQTTILEAKGILAEIEPVREQIYLLTIANSNQQALEVFSRDYAPKSQRVRDVLNELGAIAAQNAEKANTRSVEIQNAVGIAVTAGSVVTLLAAVAFCIYIIRSLTKPILEIENAATRMAGGNLNAVIAYQSRDELGNLSNTMRGMMQTLQGYIGNISEVLGSMAQGNMTVTVDMDYIGDFAPIKDSMETIISSLNSTLVQINQAAEQVAGGSNQVSSGAQALSQGTTEQASSVEELSGTITEISERIRANAQNAQKTNSVTIETGNEVERCNKQMEMLIAAMNEISQTSDQIERIIKTIEDIAFQTNILALNAAVEAARAGSAGKGFAVVADEVRSLAAKSAEAAKNTTELIANSTKAVQNGGKIAAETAQSLSRVKEKAQSAISLVDEIAGASNEQANAVMQITQGVEQISIVVQTNSATAEESAAASEELNSQAQLLKELVEGFELSH